MTAPLVFDGAMHGAAFLTYVQKVLVPTLRPAWRRLGAMSATAFSSTLWSRTGGSRTTWRDWMRSTVSSSR